MERFVKVHLRVGIAAMNMVAANGALRTLPLCVLRKNVQVELIVVAALTVLMLVAQDYVVHLHYCLYISDIMILNPNDAYCLYYSFIKINLIT